MKNVVILGSTGAIGTQTLEVIRQFPKDFRIIGLSTNNNTEFLKKQVEEFKPEAAAIINKDNASLDSSPSTPSTLLGTGSLGIGMTTDRIFYGEEGLARLATLKDADLVIVSVVGLSGLLPTLEAIKAKKDVALATKEVMVLAGELVQKEVKKAEVNLIPIDSEISAIFQSLKSGQNREVAKLILTMGKGRISVMNKDQLEKVTIEEVMNRKTWTMGAKISVDSASCLNKAFEVIESRWFFDISPNKINIVVHPEYLCHSMVEFIDGSIIGEFGTPDMRRYIQYALFYPRRMKNDLHVNLAGKTLTFEEPAFDKFPGLRLGFEALKRGGTMPAILHGADTIAVEAFVSGKIGFMDIPKVIIKAMEKAEIIDNPNLSQIIEAEKMGQKLVKESLLL